MKYNISLLFILSLAIFSFSCKKDAGKHAVELEYRIEPRVDMLYRATYTNAAGTDVVTMDGEADFPGGSRKITVKPPFTAKLKVEIENIAPTLKYFTLTILINGETKAVKEFPVPPNSPGNDMVQYTIE